MLDVYIQEMFSLTYILFLTTYFYSVRAVTNVVINEVLFVTPEEKDQNEFIALQLVGGSQRTMEHLRLHIIDSCAGILYNSANRTLPYI